MNKNIVFLLGHKHLSGLSSAFLVRVSTCEICKQGTAELRTVAAMS